MEQRELSRELTPRELQLLRIWRESFFLSQGSVDLQQLLFSYLMRSGVVGYGEYKELAETHRSAMDDFAEPPSSNHITVNTGVAPEVNKLVSYLNKVSTWERDRFKGPDAAIEETAANAAAYIGDEMLDQELTLLFRPDVHGNTGRKEREKGSDPYESIIREVVLSPQHPSLDPAYDGLISNVRTYLMDISSTSDPDQLVQYPPFLRSDAQVQSLAQQWEEKHPGESFLPVS